MLGCNTGIIKVSSTLAGKLKLWGSLPSSFSSHSFPDRLDRYPMKISSGMIDSVRYGLSGSSSGCSAILEVGVEVVLVLIESWTSYWHFDCSMVSINFVNTIRLDSYLFHETESIFSFS